jgi:phenylacetate-CoA ligase
LFRISNIDLSLGTSEIFRRLQEQRPDVIYGIPNVLEMLVQAAPRDRLRDLHPRLILSGAERLLPALRDELETVFGCRVVDFYGCHELNLMAWECKRCGDYHTCDDSAIIEVLRPDGQPAGPGEEGEVVGTALHSYAMPLIRIEIGDVVRRPASLRDCGSGFGRICEIVGRAADFLPLSGGRMVSPYPLTLAVDAAPGVRRYRIVQEAPERITVFFVPLHGETAEVARSIVAKCRAELPDDIEVQVRAVESIPLTRAGKHPLVQAFRG